MNKKQVLNGLLLGLAAFIWGAAFVAQSVGMDYVGPYTFNTSRSLLGGIILLPVIFFMKRTERKQRGGDRDYLRVKRPTIVGGIFCGIILAIGSSLQQVGLMYTSVGKAGFITALYIVIVPILGILLKKTVRPAVWLSVLLATVGLYFITITDKFVIEKGDFLILLCAFVFSAHILVIDYYSPLADGIQMSCIQFFVCGIVSSIPMFILEQPKISALIHACIPILYAGILSSGVAYTLQIVAQKNVNPVVASLILSLESVFAALSGWVILQETLSVKELIGCIIVFAAIILAQLPGRRKEPQT